MTTPVGPPFNDAQEPPSLEEQLPTQYPMELKAGPVNPDFYTERFGKFLI